MRSMTVRELGEWVAIAWTLGVIAAFGLSLLAGVVWFFLFFLA